MEVPGPAKCEPSTFPCKSRGFRQAVLPGEGGPFAGLVLADPLRQVGRDARVERAVAPVGEDADPAGHRRAPPRLPSPPPFPTRRGNFGDRSPFRRPGLAYPREGGGSGVTKKGAGGDDRKGGNTPNLVGKTVAI